jgi:hypothetical protein
LKEVKKVVPSEDLAAYELDEGNFIRLRDLMIALDAHGLSYPASISKLKPMLDRIDRLGGLQIGALLKGGGGWANEVESSRLSIGKLLKEIMDRLESKATRHNYDPSLYLISAHDTTLVPLLVALGVYDGNWPPFASYISFELWQAEGEEESSQKRDHGGKEDGQFLVRILFNGKPLHALPRCELDDQDRAPLTAVARGLKPVLTNNLHHECSRWISLYYARYI